jgi:hypothetical protein
MPVHKYTILQVCVICLLVSILGVRLVSQYPEWFNGAGRNLDGGRQSDRFITLGSATSTEEGFLITLSRYSAGQPDWMFVSRRLELVMRSR